MPNRSALPRKHELKPFAQLTVQSTILRTAALFGDPCARVFREPPLSDPYPEYERIRSRGPVCTSRVGLAVTADHALCSSILRDNDWRVIPPEVFHPGPWDEREIAHPVDHSLLSMNPPDHTRLRRVVSPWFTPRALRTRTERIEATVREFLDELATRERFDLISDFATRVPIRVICDLLGVDDERHADFAYWGQVLGSTIDGVRTLGQLREVETVGRAMTAYFTELLRKRRIDPGEDVVSGLVAHDEEFSERDLTATAGLLLGAGFETTRNLIGNGILALLRHPEQLHLLQAEPERAGNAVEEILRYDSPVQQTARTPAADTELAGVPLRKGGLLGVLLGAANRDPRVFTDPHRFDITRQNAREHLSFSGGAHFCLGAGLARMEGEIALRELVARFPGLAAVSAPRRRPTRVLRGIASLPMTTGPRATVIA
ncbi:cytochrome P450 [Sciscionella marina]|uniref:cytochrome P450 n=1 Tax=Sciscionella marina TaxID=508770 RepID=UPI00039C1E67|nr:cytochrome P450 [Sciscionella marina]